MNIFYLDQDPKVCAQYHCDKHVVKMILESAQLLCTAINVVAGEQVTPYKSTHVNHPCAIWVRESFSNWMYVYCLMLYLELEWNFRFEHDKDHKAVTLLCKSGNNIKLKAQELLPDKPFTAPPLCMPEHCKTTTMFGSIVDATVSYRNYYNLEKQHLHKWTNRNVPFWITEEQ